MLLLLAADAVGEDGADEDAGRERGEKSEGSGEAVGADAVHQALVLVLGCFHCQCVLFPFDARSLWV